MKKMILAVPVLLLGLSACGAGPRYAYVRVAPPPPRVEVRGYAPGPGFAWVGGYWNYAGGGYVGFRVPGCVLRGPALYGCRAIGCRHRAGIIIAPATGDSGIAAGTPNRRSCPSPVTVTHSADPGSRASHVSAMTKC